MQAHRTHSFVNKTKTEHLQRNPCRALIAERNVENDQNGKGFCIIIMQEMRTEAGG